MFGLHMGRDVLMQSRSVSHKAALLKTFGISTCNVGQVESCLAKALLSFMLPSVVVVTIFSYLGS